MRAAPQNRTVTLIGDISGRVLNAQLVLQGAWRTRSSSGMALVGCGTLWVERTERMPDRQHVTVRISGGNSAWVTMASIVAAPAAVKRLSAGDHRAARGDDIVDDQSRTPGNACRGLQIRSRPSGRRGGSSAQRYGTARAARRDR